MKATIEDDSLVVDIAHRRGDYAYPILLDPIVEDWVNQNNNWYNGNHWDVLGNGAWHWTSNNSNIHGEIYEGTPISCIAPLLHPKALNVGGAPGILHDSALDSLHIVTGD